MAKKRRPINWGKICRAVAKLAVRAAFAEMFRELIMHQL